MAKTTVVPGRFRRWAGADGVALLVRAGQGERGARRELQERWLTHSDLENAVRLPSSDYFALLRRWFRDFHPPSRKFQRTLRAIRHNRRHVPSVNDLRPLLAAYQPLWDDVALVEARILLRLGPRLSTVSKRVPTFGRSRPGRPRQWGVNPKTQAEVRRLLKTMIESKRANRSYQLSSEEHAHLKRIGILVTRDSSLGIARGLLGESDAQDEHAQPLWFRLPWQRSAFWRAVGRLPAVLGGPNPLSPKLARIDRSARDLLEQLLAAPGRTSRRPGRLGRSSDLASAVTITRAKRFLQVEQEIVRLTRNGSSIPSALLNALCEELGK